VFDRPTPYFNNKNNTDLERHECDCKEQRNKTRVNYHTQKVFENNLSCWEHQDDTSVERWVSELLG
jgi:hypothetical protein